MAKRIPTSNDNRHDMEHASFRIDDVTNEKTRATCDELTHTKLDTLIAGTTPPNTLRSLQFLVGVNEIEAKSDSARLTGRVLLTIHNDSNATLFYGPTGVAASGSNKGEPLFRDQTTFIVVDDSLAIFIIANAGTQLIIVQEWAIQ